MSAEVDFMMERNKIVDELDQWRKKYEKFLKKVSPKNWRSGGHINSEVRNFHSQIQNFQPITNEEEQIPWVKKQLR